MFHLFLGLSCTFESGDVCNYTTNGNVRVQWTQVQGSTSSARQPDHDHTTDTTEGEFFKMLLCQTTIPTNSAHQKIVHRVLLIVGIINHE